MGNKVYEIIGEGIKIKTDIPLLSLLKMEIDHHENEHGRLTLCAAVKKENEEDILHTDWSDTPMTVYKEDKGETVPVFYGKPEEIFCTRDGDGVIVEIRGIGETAVLDREKRNRSFQNGDMTYQQISEEVIKEYDNAAFIWALEKDMPIGTPIIQYEETDWEFLKRICSHMHGTLISDLTGEKTNFFMGMRKGEERFVNQAEITGIGFSGGYFENGGYEDKLSESSAFCLEIKSGEIWQMGDRVMYEGRGYRVFGRNISYQSGELICTYQLGMEGAYYHKKIHNGRLAGVRLRGTVKKCREESVYVQLDIDSKPCADYPWDWAPETNNLCYTMPEAETKADLYFPTWDERDGQAVLAIMDGRGREKSRDSQRKEFATAHQKKTGLYPESIFLEGTDSMKKISMEDSSGILVKSDAGISWNAAGRVYIAGNSLSVSAPLEVVYRTESSNIELSHDFNFYAPGGVRTIGTGDISKQQRPENKPERSREKQDHWRLSYHALGAIPSADPASIDSVGDIAGICACGSVPKVARGAAVIALAEVMEGKKENETSFPDAFHSMENYVVKGGYPLPEEGNGRGELEL